MTITVETIDRINLIATARPVTEKPVVSTHTEADNSTEYDTPIYITAMNPASEHRAESYVGKVVKVRRRVTRADEWWAWDDQALVNVGVHGSRLNPEMVNGHYYRSLDAHGLLVRYNDDDHAANRNLPGLSLSILASNGGAWPIPGDGTNWTDNVEYIEVERPEGEPVPEEPMDVHQSNAADGPTWGLAKVDEAGAVALNPAPEPGKLYLVWANRAEAWDTDTRITYLAYQSDDTAEGANQFGYIGAYSSSGGTVAFVNDTYLTPNGDDRDVLQWAELALTAPEKDAEALPATWHDLASSEETAFEELNEAMNELADDQRWCSDYEDIVTALGMTGRNADYCVEVDVTFTFEDQNPPGEFDERAAERHDLYGMTITSARYTANARVSIYVSDTTEQGARDYVDSNEIEEHLSNAMSHASDIDVDDYSIIDVEKSD
jgi:hypothetical protein